MEEKQDQLWITRQYREGGEEFLPEFILKCHREPDLPPKLEMEVSENPTESRGPQDLVLSEQLLRHNSLKNVTVFANRSTK